MDFGSGFRMRQRQPQRLPRNQAPQTSMIDSRTTDQPRLPQKNNHVGGVDKEYIQRYVDDVIKTIHVPSFPTLYAVASSELTIYQDNQLRFPLERKIKKNEIIQLQQPSEYGNMHVFKTYFFTNLTSVDEGYIVGYDDTQQYITNLSLVPIHPNKIDISTI